MNILIEGGNLNPSVIEGTKNISITHAEELVRRGHNVYILTRKEDKVNKILHKKKERIKGIIYYRYRKYELPFLLARVIKKEKIDLVHIFAKGLRPYSYLFFLKKILKIPVVFTLLGNPLGKSKKYKNIKKLGVIDKLVVSSKTIEKMVRRYVQNSLYLPYGININKFLPLKKSLKKRKIMSLRFLNPNLINSFKKINSKKIEFILSIRHLKKKQKKDFFHSIEKEFKLVRILKNMPKALGKTDILIDLHPKNSFLDCASPPLLILEAMACGAAIISTDIPEIREFIKNGKEGILLKNNSEKEIIKAIKKIIKSPGKFSKRSRLTIEKRFDIKKIIKDYEIIYNSLAP